LGSNKTLRLTTLHILKKILYWLLILSLLLILPVFQSWDFLPEGGNWGTFKVAIAAIVILIAIATKTHHRLHVFSIFFLLVLGLLLFCLNQGIIKEPVSEKDLRILTTAKTLIRDESVWDRTSSRDCTQQKHHFSLYCALHEASIREAGNFRHRRPAMQILRAEIEKVKPHSNYEHRLAGFNSDPTVKFSDLQHILDLSIEEVKSQLQEQKNESKK
jgi:hypothetical protein